MPDFAATLDTRIRFERKVPASGLKSAGQETWEPVATVMAEVQDVLPSRAAPSSEGLQIDKRPTRIRMRYRSDITADMRIVTGRLDLPDTPAPAERRILSIIGGPARYLGRQGLEVLAQDYSTAGQPA